MQNLQWEALEYEERERSSDWFWALGVIVVAGSLASIIYGDYFFAFLLVLGGALLGFFAIKKPDMVSYELNSKGLKIRTRLYAYENIHAFFVQVNHPDNPTPVKPLLFIKSERFFIPIISVPIVESHASEIRDIFLEKDIVEEEMKEHLSEKIMDVLGF